MNVFYKDARIVSQKEELWLVRRQTAGEWVHIPFPWITLHFTLQVAAISILPRLDGQWYKVRNTKQGSQEGSEGGRCWLGWPRRQVPSAGAKVVGQWRSTPKQLHWATSSTGCSRQSLQQTRKIKQSSSFLGWMGKCRSEGCMHTWQNSTQWQRRTRFFKRTLTLKRLGYFGSWKNWGGGA